MVSQNYLTSLLFIFTFLAGLFILDNNKLSQSIKSVEIENHSRWVSWKEQMGRQYHTSEQQLYRFQVYLQNMDIIDKQNKRASTFTMGENDFTDMTQEQFSAIYLQNRSQKQLEERKAINETKSKLQQNGDQVKLTDQRNINWVTQNYVPEVRNMGQCQASYAFSAVSVLESLFMIDASLTVSLSVEQVIQCSQSSGNEGCNGGKSLNTWSYINKNKLCTESDYPFISYGGQTGQCNTQLANQGKFHSESFEYVPGDCDYVIDALETKPLTVCIVPGIELQYYKGGIFTQEQCEGVENDFCMSLVGVKQDQYWILQNSLGQTWGEVGYMRLSYGNTCLVCSQAIQPQFG